MFCNGMVVLHDGRVFINGGNLKYDPFWGEPRNAVYDPATGVFTDVQNMAHGRWYPTVTTLGDGSVMTFSGIERNRRHEHRRGDLHGGCGVEPGVSSGLDAAALSAHAPEHGWSRLLFRLDAKLPVLQSVDENVVGHRGDDPIHRHAKLWHVRPAPPDAGERLHTARHDLRWRQSGHAHHGNHRPLGGHAAVGVRPVDVAAADPDERDHPPERKSPGDRRIEKRRGCRHGEPECRSV